MSIEDYDFTDVDVVIGTSNASDFSLDFENKCRNIWLQKEDVIALAKHFKLTAHDIDCSEHKTLQLDADAADEAHYDEIVKIQADKIKINKRLS